MDDCELWQFAAALGMHEPEPEPEQAPPPAPGPLRSPRGTRKRRVSQGAAGLPTDTIRQRILHDRDPNRYPKPTPKPASGALFGLVAQAGAAGMVLGEGVIPNAD